MVYIFASPPEPASANPRLVPAFGPERVAELEEAFLADTVALVRTLDWAELVVAAASAFAHRALLISCPPDVSITASRSHGPIRTIGG